MTTTTVSEQNANGGLQSRIETVTSANGRITTTRGDADGNGVYERQSREETVLNSNGSVTRVVTDTSFNGTRYHQESAAISDDGSYVSHAVDLDGNGAADLTDTHNFVLAADGTVTETNLRTGSTGAAIYSYSLVTSADKRTVTRAVDENGDGKTDWSVASVTAADGATTSTSNYYSRTGVLEGRLVKTVSQDGLMHVEARDWDANGQTELTIRDEITQAKDGSTAEDITYRNRSGGFIAEDRSWMNDDALSGTSFTDTNGDGTAEYKGSWNTVYQANGDIVTTHESRSSSNVLQSKSMLTVSGNGLSSHFEINANGAGGNERTVDSQTLGDGETTTTTRDYKISGGLADSASVHVSADGGSIDRHFDDNGDGAYDRGLDSVVDLNRNATDTYTDYAANGTATARVTVSASANGMSATSLFDFEGNGTVELSRSTSHGFAADGSAVGTFIESSGARTSYNAMTITAANGLSSPTYVDSNGDGRVDFSSHNTHAFNADGSATDTQTETYADGSRKSYQSNYVSADGRTWSSEYDLNGNGVIDVRNSGSRDAEGNVSSTHIIYKSSGAVLSQATTTDSADGLVTHVTRTGAVAGKPQTENTVRSVLGGGRYTWDNGIKPSVGSIAVKSSHSVDENGVDSWTYTESEEFAIEHVLYVMEMMGHGEWTWKEEIYYNYKTTTTVTLVVLDQAVKQYILEEAQRIYDAVLDRSYTNAEFENLAKHISDGKLDGVGLAKGLMGDEFDTRYGTLSSAAFVNQLYWNTFGHAPSLVELNKGLNFIAANGVNSRAALAVQLANSSEHFVVGGGHLATNNSINDYSTLVREVVLDKSELKDSVQRLFDTVQNRAASDQEINQYTTALANATSTLADVAAAVRKVTGQLTGLTNRALVERILTNAFDAPPTANVVDNWTALISTKKISIDEFIVAVSVAPEHQGYALGDVAGTSVNDILLGNNGGNAIYGSSGDDRLYGGAGNDWLDGGTGADLLSGGTGDDGYAVDSAGDVVSENPNEGTDTIYASVTYMLDANLENLSLTGIAEINGSGNELNNALYGNSASNGLYGGAGNDYLNGQAGEDWLYGGDGDDTLVGSDGNDALYGGTGNDDLYGGAGNDWLDGGAGADLLSGGTGDDGYAVDNAGDVVSENPNEGTDTIYASVTYALGANLENLSLTGVAAINGSGNELNNGLSGNSASNSLYGGAGNDWLDGGAGADLLSGGTGDDGYAVDNAGDVVSENPNEGTDTVYASVTYTLGANLENLSLTGIAAINGSGNELNNGLSGNSASNSLYGGAGSDWLDGGAGADLLSGGTGDDGYGVDNPNDVVIENPNEGIDIVYVSISYVLGANVENLTLTGTDAINGTGNALDNVLHGNSASNGLYGGYGNDQLNGHSGEDVLDGGYGDDTLDGGDGNDSLYGGLSDDDLYGRAGNDWLDGGAGTNLLQGGLGDDGYAVDTAGDVVIENPNEGTDTVYASVIYALGANVENLTLTGAAAINGTGNALDNVLQGNSAANALYGGAGGDWLDGRGGADQLYGGTGDDGYAVDTAGDVVSENPNEGTDSVYASVSYVLGANVENLVLSGAEAINGSGNDLNNALQGNSASNALYGGAGNDYLNGQAGNDYLNGQTGDDTLDGSDGNDSLYGGYDNDSLYGGAGNDYLNGQAGDDWLDGSDGDDGLFGDYGNDSLNGGVGNDRLEGGRGDDVLVGGAGSDLFVFSAGNGHDRIVDFTDADTIVLSLGTKFDKWGEVSDVARKVGNTTVLDFGELGSITLEGVTKGSLHKGDFLFV